MSSCRPKVARRIGDGDESENAADAGGIQRRNGRAGVAAAAQEPEAARAMIRLFTAPPAAIVLKAMGVEPFVE